MEAQPQVERDIALDGIVGSIGGAPVRGRLKLGVGFERIEGQIDTDAADKDVMETSPSSAKRDFRSAKAWLFRESQDLATIYHREIKENVWLVDHLGKGGPDYSYRIEVTPVAPKLSMTTVTEQIPLVAASIASGLISTVVASRSSWLRSIACRCWSTR